jgi:hypothetical protein
VNYTVIVYNKGVSEILDIVKELSKVHKMQIHKDFEFFYNPPEFNFMNDVNSIPRHTKFVFTDAKFATFFTLKYGS